MLQLRIEGDGVVVIYFPILLPGYCLVVDNRKRRHGTPIQSQTTCLFTVEASMLLAHYNYSIDASSALSSFLSTTVPPAAVRMSKKPFIVLIPGAWHTPAHYDELAKLLFQSGYDGVCEMNPSCDAKEPEAHTVVTDTVAIRDDILMPLIDDGEEIILVMHSYGGIPGIAAAAGLSKAELSIIGIDGGIIGLIFISTMIARAGTPLRSPDGFGPWVTDDVRSFWTAKYSCKLTFLIRKLQVSLLYRTRRRCYMPMFPAQRISMQ